MQIYTLQEAATKYPLTYNALRTACIRSGKKRVGANWLLTDREIVYLIEHGRLPCAPVPASSTMEDTEQCHIESISAQAVKTITPKFASRVQKGSYPEALALPTR